MGLSNFKFDDVLIVSAIVLLIFLLFYKRLSKSSEDSNQAKNIEIQTLIEKIRTELYQAEEKRMKEDLASPFSLDNLDLEINYIVKTSNSANADLKLEPVTVGGQTEFSSESVQKIKLHMVANKPQQFIEKSPQKEDFSGNKEIIEHNNEIPSSNSKGSKK